MKPWNQHFVSIFVISIGSPSFSVVLFIVAAIGLSNQIFISIDDISIVNVLPIFGVVDSGINDVISFRMIVTRLVRFSRDGRSFSADLSGSDPVTGFSEMRSDRSRRFVPRISGLVLNLVARRCSRKVHKLGRWKMGLHYNIFSFICSFVICLFLFATVQLFICSIVFLFFWSFEPYLIICLPMCSSCVRRGFIVSLWAYVCSARND